MLPSAQFWKCANSWRRNWRNRYQFESGLVFGFKRLSNEAMSVIGTFRTWCDVRLRSVMRLKADISESNNSGGPGGLGEPGILIRRAHMINEALTNWW